jgi:DNA mismatch repair protein MSH6
MAIAGAVLHQLATRTLSLSFFATHYGSLTDDYAYHPSILNMHMATHVDDEQQEVSAPIRPCDLAADTSSQLVFLYKLVGGVASSSFGTHVASLAGVPEEVVQRAEAVSEDFAKQLKEKIEGSKKGGATSRLPLAIQADFAYLFSLAAGKAELPSDKVRRREVLKVLKTAVKGYLSHAIAVGAA